MSKAVQPSGWRKASPGLATAQRLAETGVELDVPKARAFKAVKRVGAHLSLKAGDMLLLDTLGAFTQAQDWEAGRRPIVWASNAYLMAQTGFSLSALKRHTRRLAEAGLIAFKDSPNGKRWGRRNDDGVIVEAYGIDLAPLAARVEEFEHLSTELQAERELCAQLKRQITVARRMIRAQIEAALTGAFRGPWMQFADRFDELLTMLPRRQVASETLYRVLGGFRDLLQQVEQRFLRDMPVETVVDYAGVQENETQDLNPRGVISEPHILITNELTPVTCNRSETEQTAGAAPEETDPGAYGNRTDESEVHTSTKHGKRLAVDVSTLMQACPEFAFWARNMGGYLRDWGDVHRAAGNLKAIAGISDHAWLAAQEVMGKQMAAAAMALVFDKHAKGEVSSAGGYLRGMTEKAGAGELYLERSFYGRLSGQAA